MNYLKRPEPGRHISRERVIERVIEKRTEPPQPLDVNALANAIAQLIQSMPNRQSSFNVTGDGFDNTKTLEELAKTMIVQRGNNESNFDNLGNEQQTKTNKEEVNKTIDLLSKLND